MQFLVFDLETTGLDKTKDKIILIGYKINNHISDIIIPNENSESWNLFFSYLKDENILKVGHNIMFDIGFLEEKGCTVSGPIFDTMIAYYQKYPFKQHGLKQILEKEFKQDVVELEDLCWEERLILNKKGKLKRKRIKISIEEAYKLYPKLFEGYCLQDVEGTFKLFNLLKNDVSSWCENIEFPLIRCISDIQNNGMKLDIEKLKALRIDLEKNILRIRNNYSINLNSPKQVGKLLLQGEHGDKLKNFLTPKKQISTGKLALIRLGEEEILSYRESSKLLNTYVVPMLDSDILRGHFNQCGTITGRISSSKPNLQNIPTRTELGGRIRKCIIPREAYNFIVADYSQIEPRLLAHFSGDKKWSNIFILHEDFHSFVTRERFKKKEINKNERFIGKTVGLATVYGASVSRLFDVLTSAKVDVTINDVSNIRSQIINGFPDLFSWIDRFNKRTGNSGIIKTIGGRLISLPRDRYINFVNYLIQASASDIMKLGLLNLYHAGFKILSTIHDEVIIEVKKEDTLNSIKEIKDIMENSFKLPAIPIIVDIKSCINWGEK